jgi:hypothetical protein
MKKNDSMKKFAYVVGMAVLLLIASTGTAQAGVNGIRGSTSWEGPCRWHDSENHRKATGDTISVRLTKVGKLGVKFRIWFPATGEVTPEEYWSEPSDEYRTLTTKAAGRPFRTQFSCVNGRDFPSRPKTGFAGDMKY